MLSAAVAENIITEDESTDLEILEARSRGMLLDPVTGLEMALGADTEGATLRKELETLRADNALLVAELAAKGTPAPEPAAVVEVDNPKPETLTREAVLSAVRESRAETIAAAADRIYRRITGKLPD
jgi:hypothetical protein